MNKIILDKESVINLCIKENTLCNIDKKYKIKELNIELENNVKFILNHYNEIEEQDLKINIIQKNNSELIYNHSFKNRKKYNLEINIYLIGNCSKNTINIKGISEGGLSNIKIDGEVKENTSNNELFEKVHILNLNEGKTNIYPNMFIDTKNVIANHAASITNINKDYLFYLNSKGIKDEKAKELIIESFLNNEAR